MKIFLQSMLFATIWAWSADDIAIFNLQETLRSQFGRQSNFYTVLEVAREASDKEITRAYRKVSLVYHPDKNTEESAIEVHKLLTSIQAILKDPKLRQVYDKHLLRGFPVSRAGGYFYEKWEPGLIESLLFVIVIISFAQYIVNWVFYYQAKTKLGAEQVKEVPFKTKAQKKKELKKGIREEEEVLPAVVELKVPSVFDLLILRVPVTVVERLKTYLAKNNKLD